jgi:hypothetical protein
VRPLKAFFLPLIVLLMVLTANDAFACTCGSVADPFLKVAPRSVLVVRVKILRHTGSGQIKTEMYVKVLETLAGKTTKNVISVSGDTGNLCRPYVSVFPVGTEWVLALHAANKDSGLMREADKGDYAISICGAYWLKVKDGKVIGNVDIDDHERKYPSQEITLKDLRRRLAAATKSSHSLRSSVAAADRKLLVKPGCQ